MGITAQLACCLSQSVRVTMGLVHCSKERKLLKSMKFPKEYSLKVDVKKVNWEIMREWTALRVTQLLGMEDEVLIGYIHEQLGEDKKVGCCRYQL